MGILWNGDLVTCCMDWRRARVLGNARADSLESLWHGALYRQFRDLSNAGRLDELPLCRECGENRFSVDPAALRELLHHQDDATPSDLALLDALEDLRDEADVIQLGLLAPRGA
jgi:hypothetical protein